MSESIEEVKQRHKDEVIDYIHDQGTYGVVSLEDNQVHVYLNSDTGELNLWPTDRIHPYEMTRTTPLADDAHFDCRVLLKPDWSEVELP